MTNENLGALGGDSPAAFPIRSPHRFAGSPTRRLADSLPQAACLNDLAAPTVAPSPAASPFRRLAVSLPQAACLNDLAAPTVAPSPAASPPTQPVAAPSTSKSNPLHPP